MQDGILLWATGLKGLFRNKSVSDLWWVIKFVGTVSITLTGAVFCFVLAPTLGNAAWNLQNILTHVVVPVAAIIDFFVVLLIVGYLYLKIVDILKRFKNRNPS